MNDKSVVTRLRERISCHWRTRSNIICLFKFMSWEFYVCRVAVLSRSCVWVRAMHVYILTYRWKQVCIGDCYMWRRLNQSVWLATYIQSFTVKRKLPYEFNSTGQLPISPIVLPPGKTYWVVLMVFIMPCAAESHVRTFPHGPAVVVYLLFYHSARLES